MDGFVQTDLTFPEGSRWEHPKGACQHRGFIGEDIPEHVASEDNVEGGWSPEDMHGKGIYQDMLHLDLGVSLSNIVHHPAPEATGSQDIGLVHRCELLSSLTRSLKGHMSDPLHLLH